jgi:hypothetical protein
MARIELPSGEFVYCDDQDYGIVSGHSWWMTRSGQNFYAATNIGRKSISMHLMIIDPKPGQYVDHIDGNGLNNCRANLRLCTQSQNLGNQRKRGVLSRYKGVNHRRDTKLCHLGSYATEECAAKAYDHAARQYHGEFARLNFPMQHERGIA